MKDKNCKLTVDGAIVKNGKILLIKRNRSPFKNWWALPGGFVEYGEKVEDAVIREVLEETGLKVEIKNLFNVYSNPERDPRGHIVSIVYLMKVISGKLHSGDDSCDTKFFKLEKLPRLAFDHNLIINDIIRWLN